MGAHDGRRSIRDPVITARPLVAIHQPNFLPWLGYFDKLRQADVFIFLDDAQLPRHGGSWVNRVRLLIGGEPRWLTVPIVRPHGPQRIADVRIDDSRRWRDKAIRTVEQSYRVCPRFEEVFPVVEELLREKTSSLAELNEVAIRRLSGLIGVDQGTHFVRSSALGVKATGTERLVDLTVGTSGAAYLSGDGSDDYQDPELFGSAGITLYYQRFSHPTYPQPSAEFAPGLSMIDALMNIGGAGVLDRLTRTDG